MTELYSSPCYSLGVFEKGRGFVVQRCGAVDFIITIGYLGKGKVLGHSTRLCGHGIVSPQDGHERGYHGTWRSDLSTIYNHMPRQIFRRIPLGEENI